MYRGRIGRDIPVNRAGLRQAFPGRSIPLWILC